MDREYRIDVNTGEFPTDSQVRRTHHNHCTRQSTIADVHVTEQGELKTLRQHTVKGEEPSERSKQGEAALNGDLMDHSKKLTPEVTATILVVMLLRTDDGKFAYEDAYVARSERSVDWEEWGGGHFIAPEETRTKLVSSLCAMMNITPEEYAS